MSAGSSPLLGFLQEVYRFQTFDGFVERLLAGLQKVVRADLIGVLENRPEEASPFYSFDPSGVASEKTHRVWEHVGHEHPVLAHYLRTNDTRFAKISDFLSERAYHNLGLYNELYRGMDVEDVMVSFFAPYSGALGCVAIHRDRRSFNDRDLQALDLIRPHVIQAWRNVKMAMWMHEKLDFVGRTLEHAGFGVIILNRRQQAELITPKARRYLREFFLNDKRPGELVPEVLSRWLRLQVGDFGATDIPSPRAPLSVERPMGRLVVQLLVEADHYVLVLERQSTVQGIANECVLQLGLSPREGQVLAWLTRGKTNAEIAVILGSSARTVEKHVEHIFVKLGVETRTAAARIAFEQL